jgi:hypothetical protein
VFVGQQTHQSRHSRYRPASNTAPTPTSAKIPGGDNRNEAISKLPTEARPHLYNNSRRLLAVMGVTSAICKRLNPRENGTAARKRDRAR